jgi:two-component system alkaline phosphatase synthesis response regulator PhoP
MADQTKKVLIVEDDEGFRAILEKSFEGSDLGTITAGDGEEGLEKAKAENPDLILLDIMMPKMDGIQMAKKLKEAGINSPIIYLTNVNDDRRISEAMEISGANVDYIVKTDMRIGEIIERVKNRLSPKNPI